MSRSIQSRDLTNKRNELEAQAESEEAEVQRIDAKIAEITDMLDAGPEDSGREELARGAGILGRGAEFLRDLKRDLGDLGKERTPHERRAKALRSEVAW